MPSNFPTRAPVGLICGVLFGVLSAVPILAVWHRYQPPIQNFYLGQYIASSLSQTPIGTVASVFRHSRGHTYYVLMQNGHPVSGSGWSAYSPLSIRAESAYSPAEFHTWLLARIYGGRSVSQLLATPLLIWGSIGLFLFALGTGLDFRRRKRAREGIKLRGGDLMSAEQFNRATRGDGFALYVRR